MCPVCVRACVRGCILEPRRAGSRVRVRLVASVQTFVCLRVRALGTRTERPGLSREACIAMLGMLRMCTMCAGMTGAVLPGWLHSRASGSRVVSTRRVVGSSAGWAAAGDGKAALGPGANVDGDTAVRDAERPAGSVPPVGAGAGAGAGAGGECCEGYGSVPRHPTPKMQCPAARRRWLRAHLGARSH